MSIITFINDIKIESWVKLKDVSLISFMWFVIMFNANSFVAFNSMQAAISGADFGSFWEMYSRLP